MIPKIIHFIWVGDKEIPEDVKKCIESWKKFAPDYKILKHGNEILEEISNTYVSEALSCKKYAFVSDYLRLYVLEKFGGIYLDTDVELTAPINNFLKNDFFLGYEIYDNRINVMTGLIGCVKHHKYIKDLLSEYDKLSFIRSDGTLDETPNPQRFAKYFKMCFDGTKADKGISIRKLGDNAKIYPYWYFCAPVDNKKNYAIHHFAGSWLQDVYRDPDRFSINFKTKKLALVPYWKRVKNTKKLILEKDEKVLMKISWLNKNRIYAFVYGPKSKNSNLPYVSVIMPAYNVEQFIGTSIESILKQTFEDFELIIINDGSKDNTAKIVEKYAKQDNRIRFINNKENKGLVSVLNEGLDIARGKYIARMDSDDIAYPERFAKQVKYMDEHPECGVLGTAAQNFGADNHAYYNPYEITVFDLFRGVPFYHPSVMFRKEVFDKHHLRYDPDYYLVEDYELWTRLLTITKMNNLQEILLNYRVHSKSVSVANHELQEKNKQRVKSNLVEILSANAFQLFGFDKTKYVKVLKYLNLLTTKHKSHGNVKVYLFGYIPLVKIKQNKVLLFHFIPVAKVKRD